MCPSSLPTVNGAAHNEFTVHTRDEVPKSLASVRCRGRRPHFENNAFPTSIAHALNAKHRSRSTDRRVMPRGRRADPTQPQPVPGAGQAKGKPLSETRRRELSKSLIKILLKAVQNDPNPGKHSLAARL